MTGNVNTQNGNGASGKPPFLAFAGDNADLGTLKSFASAHGWPEAGIQQGDIKTAVQFLKSNPSPALLVIEIPSATEAPALLDALADVCDPATKVIAIGSVNEYSFYCWLMEIGVFSYLLKPLSLQALEAAYLKTATTSSTQPSANKQPGKIIAVIGARGGVGASTISLNLAGIIASQSEKSVGLADIDPQAGSIALSLDIEPSRGLREALERPDRIDSLFIERVMSKPLKNLSVLSAEESLQERLTVHDQAAEVLMKELRGKFAVTILDIPYPDGLGRQCLKVADATVLVAELTLLSLRDTMRISDLMRESLKVKPPVIIANRVGFSHGHEMEAGDFERGIGGKLSFRVPFAPEVFMKVRSDIPAIKHKTHAALKPLYDLAIQLLPEAKMKPPIEKKSPLNLEVINKLGLIGKRDKK